MTSNDQIKDQKLQYDINKEAAKISAWSSGNIYHYKYITGEEVLSSNQRQIIEQANFTYSPLRKAFQKQIKTIEDQRKKQVEAVKVLKLNNQKLSIKGVISENTVSEEAKNEFNKVKEIEDSRHRKFSL